MSVQTKRSKEQRYLAKLRKEFGQCRFGPVFTCKKKTLSAGINLVNKGHELVFAFFPGDFINANSGNSVKIPMS
jgi:hypothetical protein